MVCMKALKNTERLKPGSPDDPDSWVVRNGRIGSYRQALGVQDCAWLEATVREQLDPMFGYGGNLPSVEGHR